MDIRRFKSVAVPVGTWQRLKELSAKTHRSPAQQIAYLVEVGSDLPTETEIFNSLKTSYKDSINKTTSLFSLNKLKNLTRGGNNG